MNRRWHTEKSVLSLLILAGVQCSVILKFDHLNVHLNLHLISVNVIVCDHKYVCVRMTNANIIYMHLSCACVLRVRSVYKRTCMQEGVCTVRVVCVYNV